MAEAWVTNRPNSCTLARLDHICIESSDPQALAEFYAEHLRYAIKPLAHGAFAAIGPTDGSSPGQDKLGRSATQPSPWMTRRR